MEPGQRRVDLAEFGGPEVAQSLVEPLFDLVAGRWLGKEP